MNPEHCFYCGNPATTVSADVPPGFIKIEGCPCDGFFVQESIWYDDLPGRTWSAEKIRQKRATGQEVWIYEKPKGSFVIADRPPQP